MSVHGVTGPKVMLASFPPSGSALPPLQPPETNAYWTKDEWCLPSAQQAAAVNSLAGGAAAEGTDGKVQHAVVEILRALPSKDSEAMLRVFRGASKGQQEKIIAAILKEPDWGMTKTGDVRGGGAESFEQWLSKHWDSRTRLEMLACWNNKDGQLKEHDRIRIAIEGAGTDIEGLSEVLMGLTSSEIDKVAKDYADAYGEDMRQAILDEEEELFGLNDDRKLLVTLLRGKENYTRAHLVAIELHRFIVVPEGSAASRALRICQQLERMSAKEIENLNHSYRELYHEPLLTALESRFDGTPYELLKTALVGNEASRFVAAKNIAMVAQLYALGEIDWDEAEPVLARMDSKGEEGPTLAAVEEALAAVEGSTRGEFQGIVQRMREQAKSSTHLKVTFLGAKLFEYVSEEMLRLDALEARGDLRGEHSHAAVVRLNDFELDLVAGLGKPSSGNGEPGILISKKR